MNSAVVTREEHEQALLQKDERIAELEAQLHWFRRQLFGQKSETHIHTDSLQLSLGEHYESLHPLETETVSAYDRRISRKREASEEDELKERTLSEGPVEKCRPAAFLGPDSADAELK